MIINIILLAITLASSGSGPFLKVYMVEGRSVWMGPGKDSVALEKGSEIRDGRIHLQQGRLVIFDESGRNILLAEPGTYEVSDLFSETAGNDISSDFFKYLWKKMNKKKTSPEETAMKAGGVVDRGRDFTILSPEDSSVVFSPEIEVSWGLGNKPYTVAVYDIEDQLLTSTSTNRQEIAISLDNYRFPENVVYLVVKDRSGTYTDTVTLYYYEQ